MSTDLDSLENRLGYAFTSRALLLEALTHASYAYEQEGGAADNQRLEFLGDAVLQLVMTDYLFRQDLTAQEGVMTKKRAGLVCEQTLAQVALSIGLGAFLRLGHGEAGSGGAANPALLSDALEALLGALYLDGGLETARRIILELFSPYFDLALDGRLTYDHKSHLYEWAQSQPDTSIDFQVREAAGPEHDRLYTVDLYVDGCVQAWGQGKTKKSAEQDASRRFLEMKGDGQTSC